MTTPRAATRHHHARQLTPKGHNEIMTARTTRPKTPTNGAAVTTPPAPPALEDRVTALEQTVIKHATAVAQLLAQAVQPQLQAGILAGLTGQQPLPVKVES